MATIGGNLCSGSPSASLAPGLMILGARLKIMGVEGEGGRMWKTSFMSPLRLPLKEGRF